jgi:hypothetical protein
MALKLSPIEIAKNIKEAAAKHGFTLEVRGGILTVHSRFQGGDVNAWFRDCDMTYGCVTGLLPSVEPGSEWGTDGGSVGGMSAINSGHFKMNKSGGSKRVLTALAKIVA